MKLQKIKISSKFFSSWTGCNHWISQNLKVQFDFPWNQQMRNILEYRFRTGTSCFKWSDFEKYSKYHPKLNEKLVSSARRAKQDLARHAPASIITLRDRALRVNVFRQQSRRGLTTMIPETPRTHRDIQMWYFKKSKFYQNFSEPRRGTTRSKINKIKQPIAQIEASYSYLQWKNHHFQIELSNFTHN